MDENLDDLAPSSEREGKRPATNEQLEEFNKF